MLPRTTRQAMLLFGGLIVLAIALHLMFCRWAWRESVGVVGRANHVRMPLVTYTHEVLQSRPQFDDASRTTIVNAPVGWAMSGLFARHSPESAKLWGIAAPASLLAGTMYLLLVWRYDDRRRKGKCTACGHQLTPEPPPPHSQAQQRRCPECGTPEG